MTVFELRQQTGLSQKRFAEKFALKVSTLQAWEQGRRNCPEHVLQMMQQILKLERLLKIHGCKIY